MAEYIVNIDEDFGDFDFIAIESLRDQTPLIRCRECKWYLPNCAKSPYENRWGGLANCQNGNGLTECSDESYCSCGVRRES